MQKKQTNSTNKVLISGGHLTPALAMIDYIQSNHSQTELVFVGRSYSQINLKQKSQEKKEVTSRKVAFIELAAPSLKSGIFTKITFGFAFVKAYFQSVWILLKNKPNLFLSFGGYLAIPLALAAKTLKIPIVTHEQTRTAGQANQFIAKFSHKVALSYQSSQEKFPQSKTVVTGNPIRPELLSKVKAPSWTKSFNSKKPLLLITGGNQGSMIINTTVQQILSQLTDQWNVIHACGNPNRNINYKKELEKSKKQLKPSQQKSYQVKEWLNTKEMAWIFQHAKGAITRAGANTLHEISHFKIPSIIIPLPFAKNNEQYVNAKFLAETGGAILLPQKQLNPEKLLKEAKHLHRYHRSMSRKLNSTSVETEATAKLWQVIDEILSDS